ncbi:MAG: S49 family peptidase [Dehalococcoidia bacterium]
MSEHTPAPRHRYERITRALLDEPWAILPSKLEAIADFVALKAAGGALTEAEIEAVTMAAAPPSVAARGEGGGAIAVLPVFGVLRNRLNMMSAMSGGTSVEQLSAQFSQWVADPNVAAIILDTDSPGGSVGGIPEFAAKIAAARDVKPIVSIANHQMCSAAFWLGAAAHQVVISASAMLGSVGAVILHQEYSKADELAGVKFNPIFAGRYKVEGNDFEPLGDEARSALQALVDDSYRLFTNDLARFRNISAADARGARYGEGRVFGAREAVQRGMADRIETLPDLIARLSSAQARAAVMRSAPPPKAIAAETPLTDAEDAASAPDIDMHELAARVAARMEG